MPKLSSPTTIAAAANARAAARSAMGRSRAPADPVNHPGHGREAEEQAGDAEFQPPLQGRIVGVEGQRLGAPRVMQRRKHIVQIGLAARDRARRVHAPAEERPLGDAVGGEAPDQQAVNSGPFDPGCVLVEREHGVVAGRRYRDRDADRDDAGDHRSGDKTRDEARDGVNGKAEQRGKERRRADHERGGDDDQRDECEPQSPVQLGDDDGPDQQRQYGDAAIVAAEEYGLAGAGGMPPVLDRARRRNARSRGGTALKRPRAPMLARCAVGRSPARPCSPRARSGRRRFRRESAAPRRRCARG